jgi:hypothetical protein
MRAHAILFLSSALFLAAAVPSSASDPLWARAVEIEGISRDWVPGRAEFMLATVDDKGIPQETWQVTYHLSRSPNGDVTLEVVNASHNSADTTAKEQEIQKKRKPTPFSMGDNPFDPLVQGSVQATPLGEKAVKAGRPCAGYDFRLIKKDGSVLTGVAWLEEKTGAPVEVSYTSSHLPRGVFRLATTMHYAPGPAGEGFLSDVLVEGVVGILFFKKSFRSTITVEGYWRK